MCVGCFHPSDCRTRWLRGAQDSGPSPGLPRATLLCLTWAAVLLWVLKERGSGRHSAAISPPGEGQEVGDAASPAVLQVVLYLQEHSTGWKEQPSRWMGRAGAIGTHSRHCGGTAGMVTSKKVKNWGQLCPLGATAA